MPRVDVLHDLIPQRNAHSLALSVCLTLPPACSKQLLEPFKMTSYA